MEAQTANAFTVLFTFVIAVASVIMIFITVSANNRSKAANERMTWLTGALESHSFLQLRLAAKKEGIPLVWWDKTIEPWPHKGEHGEPADLETIHGHPYVRDVGGGGGSAIRETPQTWRRAN